MAYRGRLFLFIALLYILACLSAGRRGGGGGGSRGGGSGWRTRSSTRVRVRHSTGSGGHHHGGSNVDGNSTTGIIVASTFGGVFLLIGVLIMCIMCRTMHCRICSTGSSSGNSSDYNYRGGYLENKRRAEVQWRRDCDMPLRDDEDEDNNKVKPPSYEASMINAEKSVDPSFIKSDLPYPPAAAMDYKPPSSSGDLPYPSCPAQDDSTGSASGALPYPANPRDEGRRERGRKASAPRCAPSGDAGYAGPDSSPIGFEAIASVEPYRPHT